jgi:hypothetical protein
MKKVVYKKVNHRQRQLGRRYLFVDENSITFPADTS